MEYIPAKNIVLPTKSPAWFGLEYNMNIYKGCCHGCIYCDSRSECYRVENFDTVRGKANALQIIRDDLSRKVKRGVVGTGAMSDPYNPYERELELTGNALELINAYEFGVGIATKSPLITRDVNRFLSIKEHSPVICKVTVTTVDDELCKKIEPQVAVASERLQAIAKLADNGIYAGILLMPVLPLITDKKEDILNLVKQAGEAGARFIYPSFGVTMRNNQREYLYKQLDKSFPGIKERYIKMYGERYACNVPNVRSLYNIFAEACKSRGIEYEMKRIVAGYKKGYGNRQVSFF